MASRIASCPRAKQIVGYAPVVGWCGFAFPGFKANWYYPPGGPGVLTVAGGGPANFAVGDLLTVQFDSVTAGGVTYPAYYVVYVCYVAITGLTTSPGAVPANFYPW